MKGRLLVSLLSFVSINCVPTLPLPINARELTRREVINGADLIVVGTIRDIQVFGAVRQTDRGISVRPWGIDLDSVYVIKGQIPKGRVRFYLNNYAPGIVQNGHFEWRKKGDRRIFFLVSERGILRSISDLYLTSVDFPHAHVPKIDLYGERSTAETIAVLLLTQAPGETASEFAAMIPQTATEALRTAGYAFVASILNQMMQSSESRISTEACLTAYGQVFGGGYCLQKLEGNAPSDLAERIRKARERRAYIREIASNALEAKQSSPLALYAYGVEPNDARSVRGFFQFLAANPDRVFQESGAKQLRSGRNY